MNPNLKRAGQIALLIVTPTVIVLLAVLIWYIRNKRIEKKKAKASADDSDYIRCRKCDWSWKKSEGGHDMYVCHKCGYDNTPSVLDNNEPKAEKA